MKSTPQQRAWYFYDWANSAYVTTTSTVIIGPYLTSLATNAACPELADGAVCTTPVSLLGMPVLPGAVAPLLVTISTLLSVVLAIVAGVIADRSPRPAKWLGIFAWTGAAAGSLMFLLSGTNWELGAVLMVIATLCIVASFAIYDGILVRIAPPDERDRVSSTGWAFGYLGGGLLLAVNLGLMTAYDKLGLSYGLAIRISLLSAGLWWAIFTIIPVVGLWRIPRASLEHLVEEPASSFTNPVSQLLDTFRDLRRFPQTLLFLVAYLFFNDGIQTVIGQSSLYATQELQMPTANVMMTFLVTQFVAFFGALGFGRIAARLGAKRTVLLGLATWLAVVTGALFLPAGSFAWLLVFGVLVGLVMGGTQALSRSLYSHLVPAGRESEYFSLYQTMERGTSWTGALVFALVFQFSHSYRFALFALIAFFVVGGLLLTRVDFRKGIADAGNEVPKLI